MTDALIVPVAGFGMTRAHNSAQQIGIGIGSCRVVRNLFVKFFWVIKTSKEWIVNNL